MLDADALADVEGDASLLLRIAQVDDDEPVDVVALCRALTGHAPWLSRLGPQAQLARVGDGYRVCVRRGLLPERARWLVGHELAEWHYLRTGYRGEDIEARCDALGAALVAPRRAFLSAVRERGHRVYALADDFGVTHALALLRIGEVTLRPVALPRRLGLVVRGEPYAWDESPSHPVRLRDEGRWGRMAA